MAAKCRCWFLEETKKLFTVDSSALDSGLEAGSLQKAMGAKSCMVIWKEFDPVDLEEVQGPCSC